MCNAKTNPRLFLSEGELSMNESELALVREALAYYDLANPYTEFIRHNENLTCCITDDNNAYTQNFHPTQ